jgi:chemotaxis protein CheX
VDARYINPFIEAVDNVFTMMLGLQPKREQLNIGDGSGDTQVITSLIGISGQISGVVALRFPPPTAMAIASHMLGAPADSVNGEVIDAISELVNMVAGSAKAKFNIDPPLQLGLPTVVEGTGYKLKYPSRSIWLEVLFSSPIGRFAMELTYHPN